MVSRLADHEKLPPTDGITPNPDWTLFVSIGSLNRKTLGDQGGTAEASCAGELLTTTGSSGCHRACATKIFALVVGIETGGISLAAVTVKVSLVSNRFRTLVPGAKIVDR